MIAASQLELFAPLRDNLGAFLRRDTLHPAVASAHANNQSGGEIADALTYPELAHPQVEEGEAAFLSDAALPPAPAPGGEGPGACILGVIDDAVPLTGSRLLAAPGATRLASVWLQGAASLPPAEPGGPGCDLAFGREIRGARIDALRDAHTHGGTLDEEAMLREAGVIDPRRGPLHMGGRRVTHGAGVLDLLAGREAGDPARLRHPVIGVALPPEVVRDTLGTFAPFYILSATLFILHRAMRLSRFIEARRGLAEGSLRLPVVINMSLGVTAGPKDGSGLIERFQDAVADASDAGGGDLARGLGPVRFAVPMGNQRLTRGRARLRSGQRVDWVLPPDDRTPTFAEAWGPPRASVPARPMQVTLTTPGGQSARTEFAEHGTMCDLSAGGRRLARAYLAARPDRDGKLREVITLALPPNGPERDGVPGRWRVAAHGSGPFDLYVQRDDSVGAYRSGGRQSWLDDGSYETFDETGRPQAEDPEAPGPVRRAGTVSAYASGRRQLRVGAAMRAGGSAIYSALDAHGGEGDLLELAEWGPGRRGVLSGATHDAGAAWLSGTSAAAPQAARRLSEDLAGGGTGAISPPAPVGAHLGRLREW